MNWGRMLVQVLLALAAGGYASWFIYRSLFTWVLPFFLVVWIGGELWRTARAVRKAQQQ
ncbi:hypothetical protein [Cellulomonas sp. NTE-D12]|uniref:hypothetical protein n=1 Tax=Cellulomonas sp. NTE-D12 TaxID=2962632 RepID=UPI0030813899|nr:hypothetical protein CELD12_30910 [Cellulomonas sp. NTE-D12]